MTYQDVSKVMLDFEVKRVYMTEKEEIYHCSSILRAFTDISFRCQYKAKCYDNCSVDILIITTPQLVWYRKKGKGEGKKQASPQ